MKSWKLQQHGWMRHSAILALTVLVVSWLGISSIALQFLGHGFCDLHHLRSVDSIYCPALLLAMGNAGSIKIKKKGEFLQIKDDEGSGVVKRIIRLEDGKAKVKVKKVFLKISDITSVSQKLEEDDVILTLRNEAEYCLDGIDDPDEIRKVICKKMIQDEDDEDSD